MNQKLLATCDRILAIVPPAPTGEIVPGDFIVPDNVKRRMEKAHVALVIESAGPDCKVARAGDTVIVNRNSYNDAPVEWDGVQYAAFSEVTAFAIIKAPPVAPIPPADSRPLDIDQIRAELNIKPTITQDSDALPTQAAS